MDTVKYLKTNLVLVGDFAGKTKVFRGYKFVDGVCPVSGPVQDVHNLARYMGKCYQAYIEGSQELEEGKRLYKIAVKEAEEVLQNGKRDNPRQVQEEKQPIDSHVQPEGEGPTKEDTDDQSEHVEHTEGSEGGLSSGDGHEDAGIPQEPEEEQSNGGSGTEEIKELVLKDVKLKNVIAMLDPANDKHWTENGSPAIEAVHEALGSTEIVRADINRVAPDFNREKSQEAVLEDL